MDGWIYSKFPRRENVHIAYRRMRFFRRGSDLDAVAKGTKKEELIHSKLSTNSFPDFEEVVSIVQSVTEGSKPQQVTKTQSAGCNIL